MAVDAMLWSAVRSMIVCLISLLPALLLWRRIRTCPTDARRRLWTAASVLPFFVPELLIGFTYRVVAARVVHSSVATESLYGVLLLCRSVSITVMALLLLPRSDISRQSIYSWRLLKAVHSVSLTSRLRWMFTWIRLHIVGPWRPLVVAACLSCLVSFQEFETAALMQIDRHPITWTVWLFDAHAAHQPLRNSLMMTLAPLILEVCLLIPPLLLWAPRGPTDASGMTETHADRCAAEREPMAVGKHGSARSQLFDRVETALVIAWIMLTLMLFVIWPIVSNATTLFRGLALVMGPSSLLAQSLAQILTSLAFATSATIVALWLASLLHADRSQATSRTGRRWLTLMFRSLLLPGLMGPLVASLLLLTLFQSRLLHPFYDTWLPLLLGLSLSILPRAFLLVALLYRLFDPAAWHLAGLLQKSRSLAIRRTADRIRWRMQGLAWLAAGTILCHWCFWDVTTASLLRPVQLEPVVTRLYNEMHYGRTEALLLIAVLSAAAPWLLGATLLTTGEVFRRIRRG